jgi:branched-chain amino acid transport system substrate-binding protein
MKQIDFTTIPLFKGLDRIELSKVIPSLVLECIPSGRAIFRQGDPGDSLYIIVEGGVRVTIADDAGGERELASLAHGECVGEMALLTGEPRSATIYATSDTLALKLERESFEELLHKHPTLSAHFANMLATRLSAKNSKASVATIGEKNGDSSSPDSFISIGDLSFLSNKKFLGITSTIILCSLMSFFLEGSEISTNQLILCNMLLAASVIWTFDLIPYHAVAIALPVFATLFGISGAEKAFSGFSKPYWFLALGVFALSAAIFRTGLLYRLALLVMRVFPTGYRWQTFALALSGLVMTPLIPSSYARTILASPLAVTMSEAMRLKKGSFGTVGIAMACLLGFGHMSFMFMNGTASCAFVLGLLPAASAAGVNWFSWLRAAAPLGIIFFVLSYAGIMILKQPKGMTRLDPDVLDAQLRTLGPMTTKEKLSLFTMVISIIAFATEHLHHVNEAWIAMMGFVFVFATSVIDEQSIRTDIDWSFLISLGAMVGFGDILTESGMDKVFVDILKPYLQMFTSSKILLLVVFSLTVHLIRCALPLTPGILVSMLAIMPILTSVGIDPFVSGLVALASANPWVLKQQNSTFRNIWKATGCKLFAHEHTLKIALLHIVIVAVSVALCVPYWEYLGLIR